MYVFKFLIGFLFIDYTTTNSPTKNYLREKNILKVLRHEKVFNSSIWHHLNKISRWQLRKILHISFIYFTESRICNVLRFSVVKHFSNYRFFFMLIC